MTPKHQRSNVESWEILAALMEQHPDDEYWRPVKALARRFLKEGVKLGLNRYFRAGQSMHHFVFSTLDHHGLLRSEPRVTVALQPESGLRIAFGTTNLWFHSPKLEYTLPFEEGFTTFRRFLNQLWTVSVPDPIPEEIRAPYPNYTGDKTG